MDALIMKAYRESLALKGITEQKSNVKKQVT
jgi:hypothetical protein